MLRPKNIIIIGGAGGIGLATAKEMLQEGVEHILLCSRNNEHLNVACQILNDSRISSIEYDITDIKSDERLFNMAYDKFGCHPDGLVITSGVNYDGGNWKGFNISEVDYDKVMDTNLKGVFFMMRNFANYLHGNKIKGNICIVSSISAHRDLLSVYQISKNAISGIVHAYGKYLCERGIILNGVEPGTTDGGMLNLEKYTDGIREGLPWNDNSIRRVIRPEEIAKIIVFCMSDLGEVMSGTMILAGGGCKSIICK